LATIRRPTGRCAAGTSRRTTCPPAQVAALCTDDVEWQQSPTPPLPAGYEGAAVVIEQLHGAFPDFCFERLFAFAQAQVPGRRCWAVEGAGSYGAGLTAFLQARGERVAEIGRPKRPTRRSGAKSDALDALGAAREALACDHPVAPRQRGDRQLNRALHTIVLARLGDDPSSRAYAARRRSQGKSTRDIRRCLKRAVARQLFKLLERYDPAQVEAATI
jgi:hypothetical protein